MSELFNIVSASELGTGEAVDDLVRACLRRVFEAEATTDVEEQDLAVRCAVVYLYYSSGDRKRDFGVGRKIRDEATLRLDDFAGHPKGARLAALLALASAHFFFRGRHHPESLLFAFEAERLAARVDPDLSSAARRLVARQLLRFGDGEGFAQRDLSHVAGEDLAAWRRLSGDVDVLLDAGVEAATEAAEETRARPAMERALAAHAASGDVIPAIRVAKRHAKSDPALGALVWLLCQSLPEPHGMKQLTEPKALQRRAWDLRLSDTAGIETITSAVALESYLEDPSNQNRSTLLRRVVESDVLETVDEELTFLAATARAASVRHPDLADLCRLRSRLISAGFAVKPRAPVARPASPVPVGWRRQIRLSVAGARVAGKILEAKVGQFFAREESDSRARARLVADCADILGRDLANMRGMAQKLIQIGAAVLNELPVEVRDTMVKAASAEPTMTSAEASAIAKRELGKDPSRVFSAWDEAPIGSGSIGQVHRARLADGGSVAVKVQYPDVQKAIKNDVAVLRRVSWIVRALYPTTDFGGLIDNLQASALRECDFGTEATYYAVFGRVFAGDAHVHVPRVHGSLSTQRLLVTDLVPGITLAEFRRVATQAERDQIGLQVMRSFLLPLAAGYFRQDMYPGNFLVDGRRLGLIDLGLLKEPASHENLLIILRAAMSDDLASFRSFLIDNAWVSAPDRFDFAGIFELHRRLYLRPFLEPGFTFSASYCSEVVKQQTRSARSADGLRLPQRLSYVVRFYWTLYSQLAMLEASADWPAAAREAFQRFEHPVPAKAAV